MVEVNVMDWPFVGLVGVNPKSTTGAALTVTVMLLVTVTPRPSVAVRVAVNVPAVV